MKRVNKKYCGKNQKRDSPDTVQLLVLTGEPSIAGETRERQRGLAKTHTARTAAFPRLRAGFYSLLDLKVSSTFLHNFVSLRRKIVFFGRSVFMSFARSEYSWTRKVETACFFHYPEIRGSVV